MKTDKPKWLISNLDLREITNNYEWDWVLEKFRNNGITTPEDAYEIFYIFRFEYCDDLDCPLCGDLNNHYKLNNEVWKCKKCNGKFTITSGTYLHNTKLEYHQWWRFAYLVGDMKITNCLTIAQDLDVAYKTAWNMIDLLRTARKETSEHKFVNGQEVLAFDHIWQVLETLVKKRKTKIENQLIEKIN